MVAHANRYQQAIPKISAAAIVLALLGLVLLLLFFDAMNSALVKLHMSHAMAAVVVMGMIVGSLINIPVRRWRRDEPQPMVMGAIIGLGGWHPVVKRARNETLLAVNVGGCVIPLLVSLYEIPFILNGSSQAVLALMIAVAVNIVLCYRLATPVEGVGIAIPAFVAPLAAVAIAWLLLGGSQFAEVRAPVAFIAGVLGPLVGADLLHLRQVPKIATGMVSIGGAGTFDGIVLSSILAALLA